MGFPDAIFNHMANTECEFLKFIHTSRKIKNGSLSAYIAYLVRLNITVGAVMIYLLYFFRQYLYLLIFCNRAENKDSP